MPTIGASTAAADAAADASSCTSCSASSSSSAASAMPMREMKPIEYHGDGPDPLPPEPQAGGSSSGSGGSSVAMPSPQALGRERKKTGETDAMKRLLGAATEEAPLHLRCCPELSWEERVMGFFGCWAIGFALSLSSVLSFPMLLLGDPAPFAWKYSVGNVLGLASSTFLVGPRAQLEAMASPVRLGATACYLASIALTVFAALGLEHAPLTLTAMTIQFAALLWYCASFIPFGREMLRHCMARWCCPV